MSLPCHDSDDSIELELDLPAMPVTPPAPSANALALVAAIRAIVVGVTLAAADA